MNFLSDTLKRIFMLLILVVLVTVWMRFKAVTDRGEKFNISHEIAKTARDITDDAIEGWKDTTDIDYNY